MSEFVTSAKGASHGVDVVMNEDGTMEAAAGDDSEDELD
jgi:hypothetical protein